VKDVKDVKKVCHLEECKKRITLINFKCKFCNNLFCACHHLPESHNCDIKHSEFYEKYHKMNCINYSSNSNIQRDVRLIRI
jgi:predicted nucleic acid binding AN1-type Zn finger protein